jgi:site-specific recombinase XerD
MFSQCSIRSVRTDDLRKLRESWSYSSSTVGKRLELVRAFFSFCEVSGWIEKNPAKGVKAPQARQSPTLPYSSQEWERILWALDSYGEIHPQSPVRVRQQLRALVLLMRFSGLRISDAVSLKSDGIDSFGNLFIYQAKTGHPVSIPLAHCVLEALDGLDSFPYFFWSGQGALKTALTEWQERLKKVFVLAGIPDGHGHRLRDTFAVELLQRGVSLQDVSILLGHRSIRTTEKHYSPWVKSRQDALEAAVKLTWQS